MSDAEFWKSRGIDKPGLGSGGFKDSVAEYIRKKEKEAEHWEQKWRSESNSLRYYRGDDFNGLETDEINGRAFCIKTKQGYFYLPGKSPADRDAQNELEKLRGIESDYSELEAKFKNERTQKNRALKRANASEIGLQKYVKNHGPTLYKIDLDSSRKVEIEQPWEIRLDGKVLATVRLSNGEFFLEKNRQLQFETNHDVKYDFGEEERSFIEGYDEEWIEIKSYYLKSSKNKKIKLHKNASIYLIYDDEMYVDQPVASFEFIM
jgi:hypothetical protein